MRRVMYLRYLFTDPRDAIYAIRGRLACRLLERHGGTCEGRRDHPKVRHADCPSGGHTPARITPDPKATNIPEGPAPGA